MDTPEAPKPNPEEFPTLEGFGINREDYALYRRASGGKYSSWSSLAGIVAYALLILFAALLFDGAPVGWAIGAGCLLLLVVPLWTEKAIREFKRYRLLESPIFMKIQRYEKADRQWWEGRREAEKAWWKEAERIQRETEKLWYSNLAWPAKS